VSLSAVEALARLRRLRKPAITTAEASLNWRLSLSATTHALGRLSAAGLVIPIRHGLWSLEPDFNPLRLPEFLTAPYPAYVSLQTALYMRGLITQVPQVIYVVSLAPTRKIHTRLADYSVHRIGPSFFGGFETTAEGFRLALPEKALLDMLYLAPARSRLFAALPEIEIPRSFNDQEARRWIKRIRSEPRRRLVGARLDALLKRTPESVRHAKRT
jgi:predicted transcriptional regulator of viral defense system